MRTIPAGLRGTLVWGAVVLWRDGSSSGWTEHDRDADVSLDGSSTTYRLLANPGLSIETLVSTAGLAVDNTEIRIAAGDGELTVPDILARRRDGAQVYFFRYSWKNPAAGLIEMSRGSFGNFRPKLGEFSVEYRDLRQALQSNSTWLTQEACRWRYGDARCGRDTGPETFAFTVTAVNSQYEFETDLTQPDDYFGEGELQWDTGANANTPGFKVKEYEQTDGVVTLSEAAVLEIQVGDTGTATRGCRKRVVDCKARDNIRRYGGEKDKPTRDSLVAPAEFEEV